MELADLVQRIRRGDREALKTLIAEYGAGVYRKAYQKTQDKELAREATRKTFAQLVTTLQEQWDMDGWELWLNALAKKNIETFGNIRTDMAFVQGELDRELFCNPAGDKPQTAASVVNPITGFWQEGPLAAQQTPAQAGAFPRTAAQQTPAQTDPFPRTTAQQSVIQPVQAVPSVAGTQQASASPYAANAAQFALQRQALAARAHPAAAPQSAHRRPAHGKKAGQAKLHSDRLFDEAKQSKPRSPVPAVILLILVCCILVWLVLGVVMSMGWLPRLDLGYSWCNKILHVAFF